jgi:hypothetical protein
MRNIIKKAGLLSLIGLSMLSGCKYENRENEYREISGTNDQVQKYFEVSSTNNVNAVISFTSPSNYIFIMKKGTNKFLGTGKVLSNGVLENKTYKEIK